MPDPDGGLVGGIGATCALLAPPDSAAGALVGRAPGAADAAAGVAAVLAAAGASVVQAVSARISAASGGACLRFMRASSVASVLSDARGRGLVPASRRS